MAVCQVGTHYPDSGNRWNLFDAGKSIKRFFGRAVCSFAPLRIKVTLEDDQNMDCKISIAPHGQQAIPMFQSQNLWYNSRTAAIILLLHAGFLAPCGATETHGYIPFRRRRHGIIKNHKTLAL